jgi:serine protease inhibitor
VSMDAIRRTAGIAIIAIVAASLLVCSDNSVKPEPQVEQPARTPDNLTASEIELAGSANRFGLKLFRELVVQEDAGKNLFISPLSLSMALGMTYNGTNGATRDEMRSTLELSGLSIDEANRSYQSLMHLLTSLDPDVTFTIANSIWSRLGLPIKPEFVELNKTYFDALVRELDFSNPESADTMNGWVEDNTGGKIKDIIKKPISPDAVMFLINAIYFKADWAEQFEPDSTYDDLFYLTDSTTVSCPMMIRPDSFDVFTGGTFKALDLPYGDSSFSMMILLPDSGISVNDLAGEFTDENWNLWTDSFERKVLPLVLPKFKVSYKVKLNDVLKSLGMNLAFSRSADFSNMIEGGGVFIDHVIHKTFVEVDEEGTEAAAVTVVGMATVSFPPPQFVVNKPFLFVIYERTSKSILFMGRVTDPTAD